MGDKLEYSLVKETGDVLKYVGEVLTDPHKGGYDSEYEVVKGVRFTKGKRYCDYELRLEDYASCTLVKLSEKTVAVLYGR